MLAADGGHAECTKLILDAGADKDLKNDDGFTALMKTCQKGHSECAKLLLDKGARHDIKNASGWTALLNAAEKGQTECVKALLNAGADRKAKVQGWDAIKLADGNKHTEIVELLKAQGTKGA